MIVQECNEIELFGWRIIFYSSNVKSYATNYYFYKFDYFPL